MKDSEQKRLNLLAINNAINFWERMSREEYYLQDKQRYSVEWSLEQVKYFENMKLLAHKL